MILSDFTEPVKARCVLDPAFLSAYILPISLLAVALGLVAGGIFYYLGSRQRHLAQQLRGASEIVQAGVQATLNKEIVDSQKAASSLRDRERKYRSIFENAMIGIAQIVPGGRWTAANPALARMLGYFDPSEILSAQPDLHGDFFVNAEDRGAWYALLDSEQKSQFEADIWRLDRKQVRLALSGVAVRDEHGTVLYYECMLVDITESYKAKRDLERAKADAEYSNHSKSEFLANMSHELRTPLNAILGFAEIIKDELFGAIGNPQYSDYATDIFHSGQHLLSLINDILDMSKIEAGKRDLAEEIVSLSDICKSAVRLIAHRATEGRVKLILQVPNDLPRLRGEDKALKQVLVNILSNAVKFTPEGGSVTMTAGLDKNGALKVVVTDTGIGIAKKDIPKALAPFGQIESALARKYQGTGLGLPITKQLVELHGGTFAIDSELGQGTAVSFTLPPQRVIREFI